MMRNGFFLFTLLTLSSVTKAQDSEVTLTISPTDAEIGETITITVKSNVRGEVEIDNLPSSFIYGYDVQNGMEQDMNHNTGVVTTYYYMSQTGTIGKPGKYTIGPAFIKNGSKTYSSGKVTVTIGQKIPMSVGSVSAQQLKDPAMGIIQLNKTTIYEGEPILVEAKVYAKYNPTSINGYRPFSMKGALEKHSLSKKTTIKVNKERFKGTDYFSFEYDKQLIFPNGTGSFRLDPFQMNLAKGYQGFPITSSAAIVTIKPLPQNAPKDFIGAVGSFSIKKEVDTTKIKQGEVFKLWLTVSGSGNIQNTMKPVLNLPKGFIIYGDPVVTENFSYNARGADGSILYEYNVQVTREGNIVLPATTISYFDVASEKYVQASTIEHKMNIEKDKKYIVTETDALSEESSQELHEQQVSLRIQQNPVSTSSFYGSTLFWSGVGLPMFGALFFLFVMRKKENDAYEIEVKQAVKRKMNESQQSLLACKTWLHDTSSDNNAFFSNVETALKKTIEGRMNLQEDRILNKSEMYAFVEGNYSSHVLEDVKQIFSKCESSRFGLAASNESKQNTYDMLVSVLNKLNA